MFKQKSIYQVLYRLASHYCIPIRDLNNNLNLDRAKFRPGFYLPATYQVIRLKLPS
eukprot:SAG11_NODE_28526_length_320_cov_1.873303_1_plen_55_part_10